MVNESTYIVASLEDAKAKQLGQIISNEKARAILNLLTKKRATESEMARELKIPISTINYNIKQLQKSGLITIKGSYYGKKGNKVNVYALVKKLILIAPKGVSVARSRIKSILPAVLIAAAISALIKLFYTFGIRSTEPITMQKTTEEFAEILPAAMPAFQQPIPSTYYALFFLAGAMIAIGIYLLFNWRKR